MSYVPKDYWLEKGKVYRQEFRYNRKFKLQEQKLIEYLKENIYFNQYLRWDVDSVPEVTECVAVDLSPDQIENARNYVMGSNKGGVLKFIVSDIQEFKI